MNNNLIERAISYIPMPKNKGLQRALNIGARNSHEPEYLVSQGFVVDVVDKNHIEFSDTTSIHFYHSDILDFEFQYSYNFILALNIFYFIPKNKLLSLFEQLKSSLNTGAVMYFTVLGEHDAWISEKSFDYFSQSEIVDIFKDYECMNMIEKQGWGSTYSGNEKYWHTLTFIYRK